MRMWMVNPKIMCRKHLLGEHAELHMFVGTIRKGVSLAGYVSRGLVDTTKIVSRHETLAKELWDRGYNHISPLIYIDTLKIGVVDEANSMAELTRRCPDCAKLISEQSDASYSE
jgi:hypothetical protein